MIDNEGKFSRRRSVAAIVTANFGLWAAIVGLVAFLARHI
jgi:hypothetical protein